MPDSEFHDAHVKAWMAWQREPELPEYADEVFDLSCQMFDLEHGPCQDVAGKQKRMEELKDRVNRISLDCTRKELDGSRTTNDLKVKPKTTRAQSRWDRAFLRGKELTKDNPEITIDEIIKDPVFRQIWPSSKRPSDSTIKRKLVGSGLTKRGRRKAA